MKTFMSSIAAVGTATVFALALAGAGLGFVVGTAEAQEREEADERETKSVTCPGESIQEEVDDADEPTTIFINGVCNENVLITKDDITLSGNEAGDACNKADPSASADATIDGTITVDGVRATIEHLVITGDGAGVDIVNRADVHLTCNDISNNEAYGVAVIRSSNAVLKDNTLSQNGQRTDDPNIFFDCGLFALDASSVFSVGNTYEDNQYCAIEIDRQSAFKNGVFLPRQAGEGPQPADEKDFFIEKGCDPVSGAGCFTTDGSPLAITAFEMGLIGLRNSEVHGEIFVGASSAFRVDADGTIQGNITNSVNSIVRIRNRKAQFGDRQVTFKGTLTCDGSSLSYAGSVNCNETCDGIIGGDTADNTCVPTP